MIAFTADLHLTPITWNDYPELKGDSYFSWMQIVNWCDKNRPSHLILGGDVFDKVRPDSGSIIWFQNGVDVLQTAGVRVLAIQGQHERSDPVWVNVHKHVEWIGDGRMLTIEDEGVEISIIGYDCMSAGDMLDRMTSDRERKRKPDILVIHQLDRAVVPFEGAWDFDQEWSEAGLILAGDYHAPKQSGRVLYAGATHMRKIDERGEKSFVVLRPHVDQVKPKASKKTKKTKIEVERQWDHTFEIQRVPLTTRAVIELTIITEDDVNEALTKLQQPLLSNKLAPIDLPIIYVRIGGGVSPASVLARIDERIAGKGFRMTKLLAAGKETVQVPLPEGEVTLESCLSQVVDPEQDKPLYGFVLEMLKLDDPKEALNAARARLGI